MFKETKRLTAIQLKEKLANLENQYQTLEDGDFRKNQLYIKIKALKAKTEPKTIWSGNKGTYNKTLEQKKSMDLKARLDAAKQKDLKEQANQN